MKNKKEEDKLIKVPYDFTKTIHQLAREYGVNERSLSNKFKRLGYDYKNDREEYLSKELPKYKKKYPDIKDIELMQKFGISSRNTLKKYLNPKALKDKNWEKGNDDHPCLSVGHSDTEILRSILKLYLPGKRTFSADLTFGKGGFYGKEIKVPKYIFDENIYTSDYPVRPLKEATEKKSYLDSVVVDLPIRVNNQKNKDSTTQFDSFSTLNEMFDAYKNMIKKSHQILKRKGILIFKTSDFVLRNSKEAKSSGEWATSYAIDYAINCGFTLEDKFVLIMEEGIQTTASTKLHSALRHATYLVFRKN